MKPSTISLTDFQAMIHSMPPRTFENFVADTLRAMKGFTSVETNVVRAAREIDVVAQETQAAAREPTQWLVEVKKRRSLLGIADVEGIHAKLNQVSGGRFTRYLLVTSSPLSDSARSFVSKHNLEVWEPQQLVELVPREVLSAYLVITNVDTNPDELLRRKGEALKESLTMVEPGMNQWSTYQRLVREILEFLFCPPLELPQYELKDSDGRNRRDIILENGVSDGFWSRIRTSYLADYIVIDAKNHKDPINKDEILSLAHYLKPHGCGMFGIIFARKGAGDDAQHAVREQWIGRRKLIVVLSDSEVSAMIDLKLRGGPPEDALRQRIAAFRMSL